MVVKTQCEMIIDHIQKYGSITDMEAFQQYGICRLSGRIFELREKGYPIKLELHAGKNRYGRKVHYGVYSLAHK